jgi:predicted MFS family arabinose efflux permease
MATGLSFFKHLTLKGALTLNSQTTDDRYVSASVAMRMFLIFAFAYLLSYGLRSINAVIAPSLQADLSLSSSQLGLLASAYFFSFAVMQLPVGLLLDRYGSRRVEAVLMLFAATGAVLFAFAQSFITLWFARALIGAGVSACLMASIHAYALYLRPHMQASMSSWMLVAGSLGALSVTTPVHALLPIIGWRGLFIGIAVLCFIASMALWFGMPRLFKASTATSWRKLLGGYKQVFGHPHFWTVVPISIFQQGGFLAFQGLWAGPWFMQVHQMSAMLYLFFRRC